MRAEEHQENQQHIPRAVEVPLLLLQESEDLRQPPGGWGQELPRALRDEVKGVILPLEWEAQEMEVSKGSNQQTKKRSPAPFCWKKEV